MKIREAVINRIYDLSVEKNMSINAIAIEAGLPPSTLRNIINGKSKNPGIVTLEIICEGLNVSISDFFSAAFFSDIEQEIC